MSSLLVKVVSKRCEAEDIYSFALMTEGCPLPSFSPGSHIDVHLAGGIIRQYSLYNHPSIADTYRIAVLRDRASRGGSLRMHEAVGVGDVLQISLPRNNFALVPSRHSLLFAGGIGVTPLLCMAEELARTGQSFELHYCARSASRMAFRDYLQSSFVPGSVHLHLDDGPESQRMDIPAILAAAQQDTRLYLCGPAGFMNAVLEGARLIGWDERNIHREYFVPTLLATASTDEFEVEIASTGKVIVVSKDESALAALAAVGVYVPSACEQGICGTCLTRVLKGRIDHRDSVLSDAEKALHQEFAPCVSRALSGRLLLDL